MGAKQDLLSEAAAAYTELREAADSVPDSRMTETWLGSWGARAEPRFSVGPHGGHRR
jgi:hypothetical protein